MKKIIYSSALMLGMLTAATVQAQETTYYAGMGLGTVSVDYKDSAAGIDQKNASAGAFAYFGADLNDYLALETRIGATGKDKQTYAGGIERSFSSPTFLSLLAKVKYPVTPELDLFVLGGMTRAKIKGKMTTAAGVVTQNKSKFGASFGVGTDYRVSDRISLGAEWVQYLFPVNLSAGSVFTTGSKARMWGITGKVAYHF
ncbi:MAG: porin family protein [Mariprofundus sp.]|nr:porin family protein [Mariprofundus sp.]